MRNARSISNGLKSLLLLLSLVQTSTALADPLSIQSALWGYGENWCDVTQRVGEYCNGKEDCGDRAMLDRFPSCGDPARGNIKVLEITYSCKNNIATAQSREYLNWQLTCPMQIQPNALADFRIERRRSCNEDSGYQSVFLPEGYRYCWHHKWNITKGGNSDSSARVVSIGPQDGITVDWKVAPAVIPCRTFGHGWINHLWIVTGAKQGAECPPHP